MHLPDRRSVLIVDDDENLLLCLTEMVERCGYLTRSARDGVAALDLLAKYEFHTILSDVSMPVMGGIELLTEVRKKGIDAPFIVLTGYGDKDKTLAALRLGAWDFLEKPFKASELETVLARSTETAYRRRRLAANLALANDSAEPNVVREIERDKKFVALCQVSNSRKQTGS